MSKKIGLFFGTFNPIHVGHLIIANHMAEFSELDEVWLVVTPHNPHKKKNALLEDTHRLAMVRIATEAYPKLKASTIEFDLPQPNYTVNTLAVLEEKYPDKEFCLIMGEDNLKSLHKWKNYEVILERYPIFIYPRISENLERDANLILEKKASVTLINAPIVELSSTFIRKNIALNKNIKPMLSKNVWHYIDEMNFYKKSNN
ncbi:MAG: nicotinate-nucleotide adenylyltransferase [Flavobacteriaceae bacterium]|jgi:nicotinate-nucleotide adenylyltransferase|nr:nicotinate-nucleotide adenylyltransferase [Flavobacteriaceae bacterium]MBT3919573.1 nicotinate-nucleotide adenylyltransferase [Flavobacteriaceae bacterium]MBT6705950.1 nicotinate-nucleotide adenylyltransferase [Flavobacteriaceae bacterium]MBT7241893.1 nicotinate-nucleotide adenylyltransferase [Flavobacteriaceae bacterium]